jgi:hypothetical protein
MLESFKRLLAGRSGDHDRDHEHRDVAEWAVRRGLTFKKVRGERGFAIEGLLDDKPWRIEWGPPQRDYISGHELRIRIELGLSPDLQMLLLSRPLMDALERQTFEEFTDNIQTQIGTKAPEEMRWLVMFPKVNLTTLKNLRLRFGAVASVPDAGLTWIAGPLENLLEDAMNGLLRDDPPFVLMVLRGRVYLRLQLESPRGTDIATALGLFETAVAQAAAIGGESLSKLRDWEHTSATTAWQTLQPDAQPDPRKRSK